MKILGILCTSLLLWLSASSSPIGTEQGKENDVFGMETPDLSAEELMIYENRNNSPEERGTIPTELHPTENSNNPLKTKIWNINDFILSLFPWSKDSKSKDDKELLNNLWGISESNGNSPEILRAELKRNQHTDYDPESKHLGQINLRNYADGVDFKENVAESLPLEWKHRGAISKPNYMGELELKSGHPDEIKSKVHSDIFEFQPEHQRKFDLKLEKFDLKNKQPEVHESGDIFPNELETKWQYPQIYNVNGKHQEVYPISFKTDRKSPSQFKLNEEHPVHSEQNGQKPEQYKQNGKHPDTEQRKENEKSALNVKYHNGSESKEKKAMKSELKVNYSDKFEWNENVYNATISSDKRPEEFTIKLADEHKTKTNFEEFEFRKHPNGSELKSIDPNKFESEDKHSNEYESKAKHPENPELKEYNFDTYESINFEFKGKQPSEQGLVEKSLNEVEFVGNKNVASEFDTNENNTEHFLADGHLLIFFFKVKNDSKRLSNAFDKKEKNVNITKETQPQIQQNISLQEILKTFQSNEKRLRENTEHEYDMKPSEDYLSNEHVQPKLRVHSRPHHISPREAKRHHHLEARKNKRGRQNQNFDSNLKTDSIFSNTSTNGSENTSNVTESLQEHKYRQGIKQIPLINDDNKNETDTVNSELTSTDDLTKEKDINANNYTSIKEKHQQPNLMATEQMIHENTTAEIASLKSSHEGNSNSSLSTEEAIPESNNYEHWVNTDVKHRHHNKSLAGEVVEIYKNNTAKEDTDNQTISRNSEDDAANDPGKTMSLEMEFQQHEIKTEQVQTFDENFTTSTETFINERVANKDNHSVRKEKDIEIVTSSIKHPYDSEEKQPTNGNNTKQNYTVDQPISNNTEIQPLDSEGILRSKIKNPQSEVESQENQAILNSRIDSNQTSMSGNWEETVDNSTKNRQQNEMTTEQEEIPLGENGIIHENKTDDGKSEKIMNDDINYQKHNEKMTEQQELLTRQNEKIPENKTHNLEDINQMTVTEVKSAEEANLEKNLNEDMEFRQKNKLCTEHQKLVSDQNETDDSADMNQTTATEIKSAKELNLEEAKGDDVKYRQHIQMTPEHQKLMSVPNKTINKNKSDKESINQTIVIEVKSAKDGNLEKTGMNIKIVIHDSGTDYLENINQTAAIEVKSSEETVDNDIKYQQLNETMTEQEKLVSEGNKTIYGKSNGTSESINQTTVSELNSIEKGNSEETVRNDIKYRQHNEKMTEHELVSDENRTDAFQAIHQTTVIDVKSVEEPNLEKTMDDDMKSRQYNEMGTEQQELVSDETAHENSNDTLESISQTTVTEVKSTEIGISDETEGNIKYRQHNEKMTDHELASDQNSTIHENKTDAFQAINQTTVVEVKSAEEPNLEEAMDDNMKYRQHNKMGTEQQELVLDENEKVRENGNDTLESINQTTVTEVKSTGNGNSEETVRNDMKYQHHNEKMTDHKLAPDQNNTIHENKTDAFQAINKTTAVEVKSAEGPNLKETMDDNMKYQQHNIMGTGQQELAFDENEKVRENNNDTLESINQTTVTEVKSTEIGISDETEGNMKYRQHNEKMTNHELASDQNSTIHENKTHAFQAINQTTVLEVQSAEEPNLKETIDDNMKYRQHNIMGTGQQELAFDVNEKVRENSNDTLESINQTTVTEVKPTEVGISDETEGNMKYRQHNEKMADHELASDQNNTVDENKTDAFQAINQTTAVEVKSAEEPNLKETVNDNMKYQQHNKMGTEQQKLVFDENEKVRENRNDTLESIKQMTVTEVKSTENGNSGESVRNDMKYRHHNEKMTDYELASDQNNTIHENKTDAFQTINQTTAVETNSAEETNLEATMDYDMKYWQKNETTKEQEMYSKENETTHGNINENLDKINETSLDETGKIIFEVNSEETMKDGIQHQQDGITTQQIKYTNGSINGKKHFINETALDDSHSNGKPLADSIMEKTTGAETKQRKEVTADQHKQSTRSVWKRYTINPYMPYKPSRFNIPVFA